MKHFWREVQEYLSALIVAFSVVTFGFTTVGVAGPSVQPTLTGGSGRLPESPLVGDRVFVPKHETWLRRLGVMSGYSQGDIVIVRDLADLPARQGRRSFVIKRVIGVPGDTVEGQAGQVWVNGERLNEGFLGAVLLGQASFPALTLGQKEYFVMGDNRTHSADSRLYGPIPFMSIAGRASAIIWPPRRNGKRNWKVLRLPEAFAALSP